eukprot:scaffold1992_cov113-Cylindrotheca_fusiformis.AAC.16
MAQDPSKKDIQFEDVEDYTSDYPPDYAEGDEDFAGGTGEKRVGMVRSLVTENKKMTALLGLVFVLIAAIIGIVVASGDEGHEARYHEKLIIIDPSKLDDSVTEPLMEELRGLYDRHNLDVTPLEADGSPQRLAFYWWAYDNQKNLDHTSHVTRYALAVLYYSMNKVPSREEPDPITWYIANRWLTKANFCQWHGIRCDENERVIGIDMVRNYLSGKVPEELVLIKDDLLFLNVTENDIYMRGDDFDVFKQLTNLEILNADNNFLYSPSGLPPQMRHLTNLEELTLSYNLFEGTFEGQNDTHVLSGMTSLKHLDLESNFLTGSMPTHIGQMDTLTYLYIRRNELKGDLSFLESGTMTIAMWLDGNEFTGTIPAQIGQLGNLASLSMSKNKLIGSIPNEMGNAMKLRRVWLNDNDLTGTIPNSLSQLSKLEVFEVHNNKLDGSMPTGICDRFESVTYENKALTSDCKNCNPSCCTECF